MKIVLWLVGLLGLIALAVIGNYATQLVTYLAKLGFRRAARWVFRREAHNYGLVHDRNYRELHVVKGTWQVSAGLHKVIASVVVLYGCISVGTGVAIVRVPVILWVVMGCAMIFGGFGVIQMSNGADLLKLISRLGLKEYEPKFAELVATIEKENPPRWDRPKPKIDTESKA